MAAIPPTPRIFHSMKLDSAASIDQNRLLFSFSFLICLGFFCLFYSLKRHQIIDYLFLIHVQSEIIGFNSIISEKRDSIKHHLYYLWTFIACYWIICCFVEIWLIGLRHASFQFNSNGLHRKSISKNMKIEKKTHEKSIHAMLFMFSFLLKCVKLVNLTHVLRFRFTHFQRKSEIWIICLTVTH